MSENKDFLKPEDDKEIDKDELGENTELTEIAIEFLKEKDKKVEAVYNQQNKGFEGEDG